MDYSKEQLARMWLKLAPIQAWNKLDKLKERLGGALGIWDQYTPRLYDELGEQTFALLADARAERCGKMLRQLENCQGQAVFLGEADYPPLLAQISDPPDVLFVRGNLALNKAVAIVGSRRSTRYGAAQARRISGELAERNIAVVSGLARGIDTAAHLGALSKGGVTVGVLGCGFGRYYPPENRELEERMAASGGAVITEFAPDTPPLPYHFPVRNRIISGLCQAVLLIEAQEKSGTHSTINHALAQGREVFALPGNVDAPGSELPLKILKEGANLCTGAADILSVLRWHENPPVQASFFQEKEENDPILRSLSLEEKTLEELLQETGLPVDELSTQLTLLELSGQIERRAGRAYARCRIP